MPLGIVYYANWLRFLERGRTELLRLLGQEHSALRDERGVNWVVRRCALDYLKPARLDETIEVVTSCGEMRGASLDMLQEARRGEETLVRAELVVACMNEAAGRRACLEAESALAQVAGQQTRPARAIFKYDAKNKRRYNNGRVCAGRQHPPCRHRTPLSTCRSMACSCRPTGSSRR